MYYLEKNINFDLQFRVIPTTYYFEHCDSEKSFMAINESFVIQIFKTLVVPPIYSQH